MGIEQSVESVIINNTEVICNVLEDEIFATSKNLSNRKAAPRNRDKCYAIKEIDNLTDAEFTRMFRLNRASFYYLLYKISPLIEIKENSINNFNVP